MELNGKQEIFLVFVVCRGKNKTKQNMKSSVYNLYPIKIRVFDMSLNGQIKCQIVFVMQNTFKSVPYCF